MPKPFHVSIGTRQGGVLSPYLFAVYIDYLSLEWKSIKVGCVGEVLLHHLMFSDDICVFCPGVHWLQRIRDVCQAYAESHGIIVNCNKTVCMTFKAKTAKIIPLLTLGVLTVKFFSHYKYLGIVLDIEFSDDKDIQRQLQYQYYAVMRASLSDVERR